MRKVFYIRKVSRVDGLLQWGRNLIVAEGNKLRWVDPPTQTLQWGRNLIVAEGVHLLRFPVVVLASMGPQLDSCGRVLVEFSGEPNLIVLQWGRNLIVAEGDYRKAYPEVFGRLQWGRNLIVAEGCRRYFRGLVLDLASMGPQLDSCGRKRTESLIG